MLVGGMLTLVFSDSLGKSPPKNPHPSESAAANTVFLSGLASVIISLVCFAYDRSVRTDIYDVVAIGGGFASLVFCVGVWNQIDISWHRSDKNFDCLDGMPRVLLAGPCVFVPVFFYWQVNQTVIGLLAVQLVGAVWIAYTLKKVEREVSIPARKLKGKA